MSATEPRPMTPLEIGWLAGIIEGEGSITWNGRTGVNVRVNMTDEDVIRRLAETTGVGRIRVVPPRIESHKTQWCWSVNHRNHVEQILTLIRDMMGVRRRARIDEALERTAQNPGRGVSKREVKHGTLAGTTYHWRHGEKPCPACRQAKTDWQRNHRRETGYYAKYAAKRKAGLV